MAENNEPVGFLQLVRISEYSRVMRAIQLEREIKETKRDADTDTEGGDED